MGGLKKRLASSISELATTGLRVAFRMLEISTSCSSTFMMHHSSPDVEKQDNRFAGEYTKNSDVFHREFHKYKDRRCNLHKIWSSLLFQSAAENLATVGTNEVP